jgi:AhpD family alkylhydroperoxidase
MFKKRIFTPVTFLESLAGLLAGLPGSLASRMRKGISHAFAEKLRLATTSVNGCVYCSFVHSRVAMRAGITKEEIDLLLKGEIGGEIDSFEAPGLLFAQHYAESSGKPDKSMTGRLMEIYGDKLAKDIMTFVREIQFANLSGNTFDAFLSRLGGDPAAGSSPVFEAFFFIVSLPIQGPVHLAMKMHSAEPDAK